LDNGDKRDLYNGFGDSLARAVEFVAVPAVFGFLGHVLDGAVGTASVFTVGFVVFAFVGTVVRSYYAYEAAMKEHEARSPWRRPPVATPTPAASTAPGAVVTPTPAASTAPGAVVTPTPTARRGWGPAGG
jgi:hypothetical protein